MVLMLPVLMRELRIRHVLALKTHLVGWTISREANPAGRLQLENLPGSIPFHYPNLGRLLGVVHTLNWRIVKAMGYT